MLLLYVCICISGAVDSIFWGTGMWGEVSAGGGFLLLVLCNNLMTENNAQC